jgi:hypothetical protein
VDDVGKVQNEFHRRYQDILKGMYNAETFGTGPEAATQYAETANRLTIFANTNKDATSQDYESYFANLTAETQRQHWFSIAARWIGGTATAFSPRRLVGYATEMRVVVANVEATLFKQRAVRDRIQSQAQQRQQQRQIGRVVTHKGQQWRLVKRGETADQDIYERVEDQ